MKKTPGVVGPQMAHRVVSSPEMPPFPFTFDELLRHHRTCVILFLDQISFSLIPASYFHSTSIIVAFRSSSFLNFHSCLPPFESVPVRIFYSITTCVYVCSFFLEKEYLPFLCKLNTKFD